MNAPEIFGQSGPLTVHAVTLANASGARARLISFGARLTELHMPDRDGRLGDIVLGFDTLADYEASGAYFGATCGRVGNRIAAGQIAVDGTGYQLDCNEGANQLHGGRAGFDRKTWAIGQLSEASVTFTTVSDDGEMGFPGRCTLRCRYDLTDDNRLLITMEADTDKPTLINMVHHSYFNLAGQGAGDVRGHQMRIAARFYTPVDHALLTTGEVLAVAGTPFDFTTSKPIGRDFAALQTAGYDHNWCLDAASPGRPELEAYDPASGRRMTLTTTEPGVQFYTGGHIGDGLPAKGGHRLGRYAGFAVETQKFPGTPGHRHFPSAVLRPGETYSHRMAFHFTTDAA